MVSVTKFSRKQFKTKIIEETIIFNENKSSNYSKISVTISERRWSFQNQLGRVRSSKQTNYTFKIYFQIELKTTVLRVDRYNKILFDEQNRIIGNTVISFLITKAVITTHCIKSFENFELQTSRSKHCGAILKKILKMVTAVLRTKRL